MAAAAAAAAPRHESDSVRRVGNSSFGCDQANLPLRMQNGVLPPNKLTKNLVPLDMYTHGSILPKCLRSDQDSKENQPPSSVNQLPKRIVFDQSKANCNVVKYRSDLQSTPRDVFGKMNFENPVAVHKMSEAAPSKKALITYDIIGSVGNPQLGQKRKERPASNYVESRSNSKAVPARYRTQDLISAPYDMLGRALPPPKNESASDVATPRAFPMQVAAARTPREEKGRPRKRHRVRFAPAVDIAVYRAESDFASDAALVMSPLQTGLTAALQHEDGKSDAEKGERYVRARRRLRTMAPDGFKFSAAAAAAAAGDDDDSQTPAPLPATSAGGIGGGGGGRRQFAQKVLGQMAVVFGQVPPAPPGSYRPSLLLSPHPHPPALSLSLSFSPFSIFLYLSLSLSLPLSLPPSRCLAVSLTQSRTFLSISFSFILTYVFRHP